MWIALMMGKALNYRRPSIWSDKIKEICGNDVKYEAVGNSVLSDNGDWYLFIKDPDWEKHIVELKKIRWVVSVVSDGDKPYIFSNQEVQSFVGDIKTKLEDGDEFSPGDAVKVKNGYLSGLYGIVESIRGKRARVFFSFHIRGFTESLKKSDLEFVKNTSFIPDISKKQLTMGGKVVFTNHICR